MTQAVPLKETLAPWQRKQPTRDGAGAVPALHIAHGVVASASLSDVPAAQVAQAVAPGLAYAPTLHAAQSLALVALLARPAVHLAQTAAPACANVPTGHGLHAVLPAFDVRPGAHSVQINPSPTAPFMQGLHHRLPLKELQRCPRSHTPATHALILLAYAYIASSSTLLIVVFRISTLRADLTLART